MAAIAKKILITTERHEVFVIRENGQRPIHGFCPACADEVEMFTLDTAVTRLGRGTREIVSLIERDAIHAIETGSGHLLICSRSLTDTEFHRLGKNKE